MKEPPTPLYYHRDVDCYECMGCGAAIEVPWKAVLKNGQAPVAIKEHPENRLLWLELMQFDHGPCLKFSDARMAEQAREFRSPVIARRGLSGTRSAQNPAASAA